MYDYLPYILGGLMALLGLYMVLCPAKATKKELRDSAADVNKTKKSGFVVIGCGVVLVIIGLL
ncbi:MAG: hypothetical protein UFG06_05010 [Lachnospiraceae bacterium]|nr:hypothetical protein [Lachnospiraceae bacterium]